MQEKTVDAYIEKHNIHKEALTFLRALITKEGFEETVKWGAPVYTIEGKNVVGLGAFKSYVGIWFFQGALMKDPHQKLINAQEGKTKALRQWRFNQVEEIEKEAPTINAYLKEARANQLKGKTIKANTKKPLIIPPELQAAMDKDNELNKTFDALNLTKKRDFAEYIETAKQAATKQRRLEKIVPMIKVGVGLNDKYQK